MKIEILIIITILMFGCSLPEKEVQVEYIAHASFKLTYEEKSLLIDPFADTIWIDYKFPKNITADAALITHPHYDHDGGRFRGITPYWENQLEIIEEPGSYTIGDFKITGLKGKHCDPYGKEFDQKNTIWVIEVAGLKFVHLGDNGPLWDEHYEVIGRPDVLFIPIDSDHHILKIEELETVLTRLNPMITVPMHYRLSDLEEEGLPRGGLGGIDPYLEGKSVTRIEGNTSKLSTQNLSDHAPIVVFEHSADVVR